MGIRFFCPNGHKLNVKEHLAGKTGFCPECGARLVIPLKSTRKSSKELHDEEQRRQTVDTPPSTAKVSLAKGDDAAELLIAEFPPAESPPASTATNPALQDANAVWYVQVPDGPQYGPAASSVVLSWIQQGRISADMLVWREGWDNWQEAKTVFPEVF